MKCCEYGPYSFVTEMDGLTNPLRKKGLDHFRALGIFFHSDKMVHLTKELVKLLQKSIRSTLGLDLKT